MSDLQERLRSRTEYHRNVLSERYCVYRLDANSNITRIAGNGRSGYSGDGVPATQTQLGGPTAVAVDSSGNILIADAGNHRIRRVSPNGVIATIAGTGTAGFSGDAGPAVNAQFDDPQGIAVDGSGNIYVADTGNSRIRRITPNGVITTIAGVFPAGFSGDGGPAAAAQLHAPTGVAVDGQNNLYIADSGNVRLRRIAPNGIISTIAGTGTSGYSGDGGLASGAEFTIVSVTADNSGNLFLADVDNSRIRKIATDGTITTVAGTGIAGFSGDGGQATLAQLNLPNGVAVDAAGNLNVADAGNFRIRKIAAGIVTTIAGNGNLADNYADGAAAASVQLSAIQGVAVDGAGNLFISDLGQHRIRKVSNGVVTTYAGDGVAGYSGDSGPAIDAQLHSPGSIACDGSGNLYIADQLNSYIRRVGTDGTITSVAGNGTPGFSGDGGPASAARITVFNGIAVDSAGNIYFADDSTSRIRKIDVNGIIATVAGNGVAGFSGDGGLATSAQLSSPSGVAVDSAGNLYIADANNFRVRKVSATGIVSTIAGTGAQGYSGDGGPASSALLGRVDGIAIDASGNLYIVDGVVRIRKISAGGIITTIAGSAASGYAGDGGPATSAQLSGPTALAVDASGDVFIADTNNSAVRELTPANQAILIGAVVDAAGESAIPVSPGKIVVIYGAGLGPAQGVLASLVNDAFAAQVAGTTVSFNGIPATVYYTSATQVNAIVPYEISGTTANVTVAYQGAVSSAFPVAVAPSSPSFFTANASGAGQAKAATIAMVSMPNTALFPAKIGGYVALYITGEGQTTPAGVDGMLGGLTPAIPNLPVSVTVGGIPAVVQYYGGIYGVVAGMMQVNVQIPAGVTPGGYVPVVLKVGNASTVDGAVWIAVSN